MILLLFLFVLGLLSFLYINKKYETFADPYSLDLHALALAKQDWSNATHGRKLYYFHNQVPQHYKE